MTSGDGLPQSNRYKLVSCDGVGEIGGKVKGFGGIGGVNGLQSWPFGWDSWDSWGRRSVVVPTLFGGKLERGFLGDDGCPRWFLVTGSFRRQDANTNLARVRTHSHHQVKCLGVGGKRERQ